MTGRKRAVSEQRRSCLLKGFHERLSSTMVQLMKKTMLTTIICVVLFSFGGVYTNISHINTAKLFDSQTILSYNEEWGFVGRENEADWRVRFACLNEAANSSTFGILTGASAVPLAGEDDDPPVLRPVYRVELVIVPGDYVSSEIVVIQVREGDVIASAEGFPSLTISGYVHTGWYRDSEFILRFNDNTPVMTDLRLYARWQPSSASCMMCSSVGWTDIGAAGLVAIMMLGTMLIVLRRKKRLNT